MKILVTGGAGFIGSNFVKWLLKTEPSIEIINLDALTYSGNLENIKELLDNSKSQEGAGEIVEKHFLRDNKESLSAREQEDSLGALQKKAFFLRHTFVKGNICDEALVGKLVQDVDMVINFAAESHVDRSIEGPSAFIKTNINGTFNLLEQVRLKLLKNSSKKIRFVQVSTDEVYGSLDLKGEERFTEETPLASNSPYSSSKASADLLVRAYHHTFGMDVITTRCSNNYGPYQFPEKLIPLMIHRAKQNLKLPVYGDGKNIRDWIHVEDHARGIWLAATKGQSGEVYNLGSDNEWANIDIVKEILRILEKPETLIEFVKDRPGHDRRYAIDSSKAQKELGYKAQVNFPEGLRETIAWYMKNEEWLDSVTSGEYQKFYEKWYGRRS